MFPVRPQSAGRRTISTRSVSNGSARSWLETPDQVLMWGVALGLQADLVALLDRAAAGAQPASASSHPLPPAWWRGAPGPTTRAAAMFAAIERIGSVAESPS